MKTINIERLTLTGIMKRVDKWFMLKKVKVELTEKVKEGEYDEKIKLIRVNPKLNKPKFAEVYIHEILHHDWLLDHNFTTRSIGYRSYGYKKDKLSVLILNDIFRKNAGWLKRV
jgi:hypothetical protein